MIKLVPYLFRTCKREILQVAVLGFLGGASSAGLIAVVNAALHRNRGGSLLLAGFSLAALLKIISDVLSNVLLLQLTHKCIFTLCDQLCRRVTETSFQRLEEVGPPRILACLTDDVSTLSAAIQEVPRLVVNSAVLAGCALYLAWMSWFAALAALVMVAVGAFCYRFLLARAHRAFRLARAGRDTLFGHFRALTEGIKELKLNQRRREAFLSWEIGRAIENLRAYGVDAMEQHIIANAWTQVAFYLLLAVLLFALPAAGMITQQALTVYVFTALFMVAPLWAVIAALPTFDRGQTALERIEALGLSFEAGRAPADDPAEVSSVAPRVQFRAVQFAYARTGNGDGFTLGPLDLSLSPGELVFVVGGNGCGKSTFVKVLTGLYSPLSGEIEVNGQCVTAAAQESYRQLFSVVYSDFYLFDRLLGISPDELRLKARDYLLALQLAHKVRIEGDMLSTTALSQGQRRRLASLIAYLEDRPIYVLDEWAADQDPAFREVFYTRLLPELKRKGKTVVVVTHDDRYYHLGDRIIRLDYGKVRSSWAGAGANGVAPLPYPGETQARHAIPAEPVRQP